MSFALSLLLICLAAPVQVQPLLLPVYAIDPARSKIELGVFRGGLFKTFGHDHTVAAKRFSGNVRFDPSRLADSSVSLSIGSNSLSVIDSDASVKERSEVQATMEGPNVLDVQSFSGIEFVSTKVRPVAQKGNDSEVQLSGRLKLHGVEKEITFPVKISVEKGQLHATGVAVLRQTDFGIVPIKLAAGTVRVKDEVKVSFDIMASER